MWDYVRYGANDFLGEVTLDLGNHPLDDEPEWYILQPHQDTAFHSVSRPLKIKLQLHLSLSLSVTEHKRNKRRIEL